MYFFQTTADSSDTANRSISMSHFVDDLCDTLDSESTDSVAYPLAKKARALNVALEKTVAIIINSDGVWQWDDTNHSNLPIGTGTLIQAQQTYTFTSEYLKVERVKVLDVNSNWVLLKPLDEYDLEDTGIAIEEYFAATGLPEYYDIIGDTIRLFPAPTSTAVTLASGLKVEYVRAIDFFTSTSATYTQEPGIPSTFHPMLCYMMAIPYCTKHHKDRGAEYKAEVADGMKELEKHFAKRWKDR